MKFTLFWKTGQREVVEGRSAAQAMTLAGYSAGAVGALDFWAKGDCRDYVWSNDDHRWNPTPDSPLGQALAEIGAIKARHGYTEQQ